MGLCLVSDITDRLRDLEIGDDISTATVERYINETSQYIFDRVRNVITDPETTIDGTLIKWATFKTICESLVTCKVAKVVYKLNLEAIPDIIKNDCDEAKAMLDEISPGISFDIDSSEEQTTVYSESDENITIFKTTNYDGTITTEDNNKPIYEYGV